jgi:hypothetical protein
VSDQVVQLCLAPMLDERARRGLRIGGWVRRPWNNMHLDANGRRLTLPVQLILGA